MQTSPVTVRRALHHVYATAAIVLIATGVFLGFPDMRARLIGGYGREILDYHLWSGWIFLAAPLLALALAARPLLADLRERLAPNPDRRWRRLHVASALTTGSLLGISGLILWLDLEIPRPAADLVSNVHEIVSWVVLGELSAHLVMARRKIFEKTRSLLGLSTAAEPEQELFDFSDDD